MSNRHSHEGPPSVPGKGSLGDQVFGSTVAPSHSPLITRHFTSNRNIPLLEFLQMTENKADENS